MLPYCWRDETPLSNHELRMDDDVYQTRQDPALTVGFAVAEGDLAGEGGDAGLTIGVQQHCGQEASLGLAAQYRRKHRRRSCHTHTISGLDDTTDRSG